MPRSTKNSQASGGAASSSAAGDEEQTVDGDNRKKLTQEEKARQRQLKQDFSKNMYAIAMAYLKEHLKRLKTEGKGDCWLLSILAGFEAPVH